MNLKNIITSTAIASTLLASNVKSQDNLELNMSALTNQENTYQIDADAKLDIDLFDIYISGSTIDREEDYLMFAGFKTSRCFEQGNLDITPYAKILLGLDNKKKDPNNFSYGLTVGYDISEKLNLGIDLRKVDNEDSPMFGIYFKIQN